jgi:hypothetical protein
MKTLLTMGQLLRKTVRSIVNDQPQLIVLCHVRFSPFALSVSKGIVWFDTLTTNGTGSPAIKHIDIPELHIPEPQRDLLLKDAIGKLHFDGTAWNILRKYRHPQKKK